MTNRKSLGVAKRASNVVIGNHVAFYVCLDWIFVIWIQVTKFNRTFWKTASSQLQCISTLSGKNVYQPVLNDFGKGSTLRPAEFSVLWDRWGVPPQLVKSCTLLDSRPTKFLFPQPKVHLPSSMALQFQYLKKNALFSFEKSFNGENHSLSDFHHLLKNPSKTPYHPTGGFPYPLMWFGKPSIPYLKWGWGGS